MTSEGSRDDQHVVIIFHNTAVITVFCHINAALVYIKKHLNIVIFPNPYDFTAVKHKWRRLVDCSRCSFPYNEIKFIVKKICYKSDPYTLHSKSNNSFA